MRIHSHISHQAELAAPLLVLVVAIVAVGTLGVAVIDPIVMNDPYAPPVVVALGAGVDEFNLRTGSIVDQFLPTDLKGWVTAIAVFVTLWSVIKIIRDLRGPVSGTGDGGALVSHAARRTLIAFGIRTSSVPWGIVRDGTTGRPLPLAALQLVGSDGVVLDCCTSDPAGRYGFRLSYAAVLARGYRAAVQARKSGFYFPAARPPAHQYRGGDLPILAGAHDGLDIVMDQAGDGPVRVHAARPEADSWEQIGAVMFWLGVIFVPLVFLRSPDLLHGLMFGAFLSAGLVRATWRHPKQS